MSDVVGNAHESPTARNSSRPTGVFSLVTAIVAPPLYVACELRNWPLFTYHPGPNRLDWFFVPAVRDWGPAMYWYGWTASAMIGAVAVGALVSMLPARVTNGIPRSLGWLTALLAIPPLVYGLRFYWR
jgi:DNA-binding transcriptional LysR family regulator